MTVETETILIKLLEELKADFKELKADFKELKADFKELKADFKELKSEVNQINVNQVRLEGKVDTLAVEVQNVKEDVKGRISLQGIWFLGLLTALVGKIVFFSNP